MAADEEELEEGVRKKAGFLLQVGDKSKEPGVAIDARKVLRVLRRKRALRKTRLVL